MDTDKLAETVVKWGVIAAVGAGMTWWVNRCMQEALREAKEITIEVKDTVGIVRDMVALPHMAKMIDFAATTPEDQTFRWEHLFAMARDGRVIIETLRDIVTSSNLTHALTIAEKAAETPALPAPNGGGSAGRPGHRNEPSTPPPPPDPELTLRQLHEVKGITENVHDIIDSRNVGKIFETITAVQDPNKMAQVLKMFVIALLVIIFACWLAWVYR